MNIPLEILSGWWFGEFVMFPYMEWSSQLTFIFFRGVAQPPSRKYDHPIWNVHHQRIWWDASSHHQSEERNASGGGDGGDFRCMKCVYILYTYTYIVLILYIYRSYTVYHVYIYVYIYICVYIMFTYMHIYVCVYIYIYTYVCIYLYSCSKNNFQAWWNTAVRCSSGLDPSWNRMRALSHKL